MYVWEYISGTNPWDFGGGFKYPTPVLVYMLLLLHSNVYEMQCLINYYGETDLQCGAHFAKNNIMRVVLVEEVKNMGCLSS